MSSSSDTGQSRTDPRLGVIISERPQLNNLAYRFLGSLSDAEDAVQETYARWYALTPQQQQAIVSPGAWLTTVLSRICLNVLSSARARRERYVGQWLPEPIPEATQWADGTSARSLDPADRITLDESISMAFLVVLESLTPVQRVVFILHDIFGYPFPEVAAVVGRTPAACRQLATSARRRIRTAKRPAVAAAQQADIVRNFARAWQARDIEALVGLLDPHATATGDGGGLATASRDPVQGADRIARMLVALATYAPELTLTERMVNGQPGLIAQHDGRTVTVFSFGITGTKIQNIWAVRNPEKLRPWIEDAASFAGDMSAQSAEMVESPRSPSARRPHI